MSRLNYDHSLRLTLIKVSNKIVFSVGKVVGPAIFFDVDLLSTFTLCKCV